MKMSQILVQTLREFPSDAEAMSHKLLVRAGYIKKLASGIYSYLPLMQRVLSKVTQIVREEMNAAGAQELLMPFVQPAEIWEKSGRWGVYGKELMRLKDRHGNPMCLAPTHEEVITSIADGILASYKQLPVNLYQIQTKFRDEIRPRFGLLRGREFTMKDAYSFHTNQVDLEREYEVMARAYTRIFERCGLETKMVQSDSGAIGGAVSHEFMVLTSTEVGENDVFYCEKCGYNANSNHAVSKLFKEKTDGHIAKYKDNETVDTPDIKSIEDLAQFFDVETNVILKSVVYIADSKPVLAYIRGDREIEETKLMNVLGANEIRLATDAEIRELGLEPGFIGFNQITTAIVIADNSTMGMNRFICGADEKDKHIVNNTNGVQGQHKDIGLVKENDSCVNCGDTLKVTRGIEVGNIFQLGTKYSKAMGAQYTDENGKLNPYIMGCYGIGITRTAAAAIEKYHDDWGIIWPEQIAPFKAVVVPVNVQDEQQKTIAKEIYEKLLAAGIEVVLDDRDERAGVKFKDADLIGFPYRVTVGKTITEGLVEFKTRKTGEVINLSPDEAVNRLI